METILDSSRPYPLEGGGLNAILNPVYIDGRRGWCDFVAGTYFVFQEVFPSGDNFDFLVQHVEPWAGVMRYLRTAPSEARLPANIRKLIQLAPRRFAERDNQDLLESIWKRNLRATSALAVTPPLTSNEDAWQLVERIQHAEKETGAPNDPAMIVRLIALAGGTAPSAGATDAG